MLPLPFTETQPQKSIVQPAGQADTIIYEVTKPDQIKLSWWARIIFHKGQARMGTWRSHMIIGWVMIPEKAVLLAERVVCYSKAY